MNLQKFDGNLVWVDKVCNVYRDSTHITEKQAYEWVKTGHWTFKEFSHWLKTQQSA